MMICQKSQAYLSVLHITITLQLLFLIMQASSLATPSLNMRRSHVPFLSGVGDLLHQLHQASRRTEAQAYWPSRVMIEKIMKVTLRT